MLDKKTIQKYAEKSPDILSSQTMKNYATEVYKSLDQCKPYLEEMIGETHVSVARNCSFLLLILVGLAFSIYFLYNTPFGFVIPLILIAMLFMVHSFLSSVGKLQWNIAHRARLIELNVIQTITNRYSRVHERALVADVITKDVFDAMGEEEKTQVGDISVGACQLYSEILLWKWKSTVYNINDHLLTGHELYPGMKIYKEKANDKTRT